MSCWRTHRAAGPGNCARPTPGLDQLSCTDANHGLNKSAAIFSRPPRDAVQRRKRECVAVFFMDLDRFKAVNDSYGHDSGRPAPVEVGRRLAGREHPGFGDRTLGGDELVLAVSEYDDQFDRWRQRRQSPIKVDPHQFGVLSIGIDLSAGLRGTRTPGCAMRIAMYQPESDSTSMSLQPAP